MKILNYEVCATSSNNVISDNETINNADDDRREEIVWNGDVDVRDSVDEYPPPIVENDDNSFCTKSSNNGISSYSKTVNLEEEICWLSSLDVLCQSVAEVSPGKQALIGGLSGCAMGYIGLKIGRFVALTAGCSLLLVQAASYKGYTPVNWKKVAGNAMALRNVSVKNEQISKSNKQARQFVERNAHFASGFVTGFLFGVSMA